ncbi:TIGR03086 family metal-binding protein [Actinomadura fibrosa]|uniref:TIGR03086 family metal-binding protein n=1 Tax=Actinomadura fibrosa TaxID=111802 RepID=A0ABW2XPY0_9ACTN|nr:TIGR03086 family metal-binding protein [Actinomadura fibrosa]
MSEEVMIEIREQLLPATEAAVRIVQRIPADRLDAPTPCPGWDVRDVVNHLIFWNGRGETAARREPVTGPGEDHDFTAEPGWDARFADQARRTAKAWSDPAAWEGNTSLSGNKEGMPADFIGGIVFGELVLHGWDIAVSTGLDPALPPDIVEAAWKQLVPTAEVSRQYGALGPEVPVPEDAPFLDRLLGLAGRDPRFNGRTPDVRS